MGGHGDGGSGGYDVQLLRCILCAIATVDPNLGLLEFDAQDPAGQILIRGRVSDRAGQWGRPTGTA